MTPENTYLTPSTTVNNTPHPVIVLPPETVTPLPAHMAKPMTTLPVTTAYPASNWPSVAHRVLDGMGAFWHVVWKLIKLGICLVLDVADFFIGRIPGFGIVYDLVCACICAALWGRTGWYVLLEQIDFTEQIDAFVPTCTITALMSWNND